MREKIEWKQYVGEIYEKLAKGILLTTATGEKVNSMVISWGAIGIEWGKPIFTVYVREHRFTRRQLDENPEFTINIPMGDYAKEIMTICGTKSGHDMDKVEVLGLTKVDSEMISVPGFKELPLTLECKVVYKQMQDLEALDSKHRADFYPEDVDSSFFGKNKDAHIAYYAEIVNAYIAK